jgi:ribosomal protein L37E
MRIVTEDTCGYEIECACGETLYVLKTAGVAHCGRCGLDADPRRLRYMWARLNDPAQPNLCQAL